MNLLKAAACSASIILLIIGGLIANAEGGLTQAVYWLIVIFIGLTGFISEIQKIEKGESSENKNPAEED